jgi:hypothetical protein
MPSRRSDYAGVLARSTSALVGAPAPSCSTFHLRILPRPPPVSPLIALPLPQGATARAAVSGSAAGDSNAECLHDVLPSRNSGLHRELVSVLTGAGTLRRRRRDIPFRRHCIVRWHSIQQTQPAPEDSRSSIRSLGTASLPTRTIARKNSYRSNAYPCPRHCRACETRRSSLLSAWANEPAPAFHEDLVSFRGGARYRPRKVSRFARPAVLRACHRLASAYRCPLRDSPMGGIR